MSGLEAAVEAALPEYQEKHGKIVGGFGHRWHPVDPRTAPLLALVEEAAAAGEVTGEYIAIGRAVEAVLTRRKGKPIPMNIDGSTAVIFSELGFEPEMGRGLFILSRSVGILSHAWEQKQQGGRSRGRCPRISRSPTPGRSGDRLDECRRNCASLENRASGTTESMMKDLVSHQLVRYLEHRGVEHIFGLCGHTNIAVLTA